jgi:hypothetical protein
MAEPLYRMLVKPAQARSAKEALVAFGSSETLIAIATLSPDWLLLYKIDGNDLYLVRTGTHADLS